MAERRRTRQVHVCGSDTALSEFVEALAERNIPFETRRREVFADGDEAREIALDHGLSTRKVAWPPKRP